MTDQDAPNPTQSFTIVHTPIAATMAELHTHVEEAIKFLDERVDGGFGYVLEPIDVHNPQIMLRLVNDYTHVSALVISPSPTRQPGKTNIDISWTIDATEAESFNQYGIVLDDTIGEMFKQFIYAALTDKTKQMAASHPALRIVVPFDKKVPRGDIFSYGDPRKYPHGPT